MANNIRISTFSPLETKTINATTTTANTTFTAGSSIATDVRIVNDTASTIFFAQGGSTVVATSSDTPIRAGSTEIFSKTGDSVAVIVISGGSAGKVYVTSGIGA